MGSETPHPEFECFDYIRGEYRSKGTQKLLKIFGSKWITCDTRFKSQTLKIFLYAYDYLHFAKLVLKGNALLFAPSVTVIAKNVSDLVSKLPFQGLKILLTTGRNWYNYKYLGWFFRKLEIQQYIVAPLILKLI